MINKLLSCCLSISVLFGGAALFADSAQSLKGCPSGKCPGYQYDIVKKRAEQRKAGQPLTPLPKSDKAAEKNKALKKAHEKSKRHFSEMNHHGGGHHGDRGCGDHRFRHGGCGGCHGGLYLAPQPLYLIPCQPGLSLRICKNETGIDKLRKHSARHHAQPNGNLHKQDKCSAIKPGLKPAPAGIKLDRKDGCAKFKVDKDGKITEIK